MGRVNGNTDVERKERNRVTFDKNVGRNERKDKKEEGFGGKSDCLGGGRAEGEEYKGWKNMEDKRKGRGQTMLMWKWRTGV